MHIKTEYDGKYWNPLPKEMASFICEQFVKIKTKSANLNYFMYKNETNQDLHYCKI